MKWIISHQSALEFWRTVNTKNALAGKKLRITKLPVAPLEIKELQNEIPLFLSKPLHVLVGHGSIRKVNKNLNCHISSGEFPSRSFIQTFPGYIVCCPELCFLQLAGELNFIDLIVLGYEFCGTYRLNKEQVDKKPIHDTGVPSAGFRKDLQLTNTTKLHSYINKAVGLKGRTNALKAINFILDGSASPMETILAIILTLPYRYGGYGFLKPQLNYCIDVPATGGKTSHKSRYYCDMYWPDGRVDVEYDSDEYHTGSDRIAKDAIRRNALASVNVTVITVSRKQIIGVLKLHESALILAKLLGKRLVYPKKDFFSRRTKLLEQLLPRIRDRKTEEVKDS